MWKESIPTLRTPTYIWHIASSRTTRGNQKICTREVCSSIPSPTRGCSRANIGKLLTPFQRCTPRYGSKTLEFDDDNPRSSEEVALGPSSLCSFRFLDRVRVVSLGWRRVSLCACYDERYHVSAGNGFCMTDGLLSPKKTSGFQSFFCGVLRGIMYP